jgi:hypothetical protein
LIVVKNGPRHKNYASHRGYSICFARALFHPDDETYTCAVPTAKPADANRRCGGPAAPSEGDARTWLEWPAAGRRAAKFAPRNGRSTDYFRLACVRHQSNECGVRRDTMPDHFYTFHQSPEQVRRVGARGGRAFGRNQRIRRALQATPPRTIPSQAVPQAPAAASIAILDACFPWLRGAEKRPSQGRFTNGSGQRKQGDILRAV